MVGPQLNASGFRSGRRRRRRPRKPSRAPSRADAPERGRAARRRRRRSGRPVPRPAGPRTAGWRGPAGRPPRQVPAASPAAWATSAASSVPRRSRSVSCRRRASASSTICSGSSRRQRASPAAATAAACAPMRAGGTCATRVMALVPMRPAIGGAAHRLDGRGRELLALPAPHLDLRPARRHPPRRPRRWPRRRAARARAGRADSRPASGATSACRFGGRRHMLRRYCPPTSNSAFVICPRLHTRTASISTANTLPLSMTACCRRFSMAGASPACRA